MTQQLPKRYFAHVAVRIVDCAQLRQVFEDWVIELQSSAIAQLHDRNSRERLRDGRPVIDSVLVHRLLLFDIRFSRKISGNNLALMDEHEAASDNAMPLQTLFVELLESP